MSLEDAEQARRRAELLALAAVAQSRSRAETIAAAAAEMAARFSADVAYRPESLARSSTGLAVATDASALGRNAASTEAAIAQAAYFKAQRRGFAPGRETEDWLEAERELSAMRCSERTTRHGP